MTKTKTLRFFVISSTLFFACLFWGVSHAQAATYYVATTGSDSNTGTSAAPFKTIQKAADIVNPGDTVIVRDGVYTGGSTQVIKPDRGGNASAWVTFKAEHKWMAVIDGQNSTSFGFNIWTNGNYLRIEDFEIKNFMWGGIWSNMQADNVVISGNKLHHIGAWDGCPTYNIGRPAIYQGLGTSYYTYDSNVFYDVGRTPTGPPDGTCENHYYQHDHAIYLSHDSPRTDHTTITNNIVYGRIAGWAVTTDNSRDVTISNNTFAFFRGGDGGFITVGGSPQSNILIQNNILYDPGGGGCAIKDLSYWYSSPPDGSITIRNNLLNKSYSGSAVTDRWVNGVGGLIATNAYVFLDNIENSDPKLIDIINNNFHLQSTSPAIDKGLSTNAPGKDYDGVSRPQGADFDIGAFEYKSPAQPICGDSSCNGTETCSTCSADCGLCPAACGDHSCNGSETCTSCPSDCGTCPPQTSTNPIAYWKLDESSGISAYDSSSNNLNGTLVNSPLWTAGKINNALSLDGVDDYVQITNNLILNNLTSFTYSAWIYPTGWGEGGYGRIISKESSTQAADDFLFFLRATDQTFAASVDNNINSNNYSIAPANSLSLNNWYHVTATYSDSIDKKIHLYFNGQEVAYQKQDTLSGSIKTTSNPITIGNTPSTDRTFSGKIDDVRIYNRALTQTEIQSIMNPAPDVTPPTYNITSFAQLAADWLKTGITSTADLNQDKTIDSRDLGTMMNNWKP